MNTFIVFDLDETIGYFTQFGLFCEIIENFIDDNLSIETFNCIFDLFPFYLRPSILSIFRYLKIMKTKNKDKLKIVIYTNNQGPKKWCNSIVNYIEKKIKYKLFDKIIYAYKINGRQVEMLRTSHEKTYNDLKKCLKLKKTDKICFIDDQYHPGMKHKNIYYLNIKPYYHEYETEFIINKLINSDCYSKLCKEYDMKIDKVNHEQLLFNTIIDFNYKLNHVKSEIDRQEKILSKKIFTKIQRFLKVYLKNKKSTRKNKIYNRKTRKK